MNAGTTQPTGGLPWLKAGSGSVTIQVKTRPRAARAGIVRPEGDALVLAVNAPPEKGKANKELIALIARIALVPRSAVTIVHGAAARHKLLRIASPSPLRVVAALAAFVDKG